MSDRRQAVFHAVVYLLVGLTAAWCIFYIVGLAVRIIINNR